MKINYAVIPDTAICETSKDYAQHALAFARKDLGLPPITIRWFVPEKEATLYGVKDYEVFEQEDDCLGRIDQKKSDVIYVRDSSYDPNIHKAVLHECYHINQFLREDAGSIEQKETFAYAYQKEALQRMYSMSEKDLTDIYLRHLAGEYGEEWRKRSLNDRGRMHNKSSGTERINIVKTTGTGAMQKPGIYVRKVGHITN